MDHHTGLIYTSTETFILLYWINLIYIITRVTPVENSTGGLFISYTSLRTVTSPAFCRISIHFYMLSNNTYPGRHLTPFPTNKIHK
jgi:hypothetical protein